jgi:hypothetical protein
LQDNHLNKVKLLYTQSRIHVTREGCASANPKEPSEVLFHG